jgi:hypothetical protein
MKDARQALVDVPHNCHVAISFRTLPTAIVKAAVSAFAPANGAVKLGAGALEFQDPAEGIQYSGSAIVFDGNDITGPGMYFEPLWPSPEHSLIEQTVELEPVDDFSMVIYIDPLGNRAVAEDVAHIASNQEVRFAENFAADAVEFKDARQCALIDHRNAFL